MSLILTMQCTDDMAVGSKLEDLKFRARNAKVPNGVLQGHSSVGSIPICQIIHHVLQVINHIKKFLEFSVDRKQWRDQVLDRHGLRSQHKSHGKVK